MNVSEYIGLILPLSAIFAYQIGWLVDTASYLIFYYPMHIGRAIKKKHIPDEHFWEVYTYALDKGDVSAVNAMKQQASIARFTRAGFINSVLIAISLCYVTNDVKIIWAVSGICLLTFIACFYTFIKSWDHWFCLMVNIFLTEQGKKGLLLGVQKIDFLAAVTQHIPTAQKL